jgi:hypothetical protein
VASDISEQLRKQAADRADRICEYCRLHEEDSGYDHQVDHIISRKHDGKSVAHNLAYSCVVCNRYKGTDIASVDPATGGVVRLFNPRTDLWSEHFQLDGPLIRPVTGIAVVTIRLLRLNAPERVAEREILQLLGTYPTA